MTIADGRTTRPVNWLKASFFGLLFVMGLIVLWVDERFVRPKRKPA